jgi:radical SAM protein with 4Fe4S-binding SPASM domain
MNWMFYLKTTETCNLNCKHCFTNGTNGAKIYWDHKKVSDWLKQFRQEVGKDHSAHCEFHGGEPFLAPVSEMKYVWESCNELWQNMSWGVTTNLVFKMNNEIVDFMRGPLNSRIGTSWDPDIRFSNPKQYDLWRKNLKTLIDEGFSIKLFISVTKGTVNIEPIDLLEWVKELGVQEMSLERLTKNGNANLHPEIFPTNIEQDLWFHKMHLQSEENNARNWFVNEFLENIYDKYEKNLKTSGTFCRDCEEKIFTLNADGTISGCPNSAPEFNYGTIKDSVIEVINSPIRINNMACEKSRDDRCYSCEVFNYCGGDCHQLEWQDNICGAPKTLMKTLTKNKKIWNIKNALLI